MTYEEIKKYFHKEFIVRNEEFEYKMDGENVLCREIGATAWAYLYRLGEYEEEMEWQIVGKK
ncbi:hypothetical protein NRP93_003200 [Clostridium botulinum]|nr:hypothetical protein [Clostridium botulinum]